MSGIMRALPLGAHFAIPYSGTPAVGDCILVENLRGYAAIVALYDGTAWLCIDGTGTTEIYDENNVISFHTESFGRDSSAAFIPGLHHV